MVGELIHIKYFKIDFDCPYCWHTHYDLDETYNNRIYKNKRGYTWMHCGGKKCNERFGIAADMQDGMVSFKLVTRMDKANKRGKGDNLK